MTERSSGVVQGTLDMLLLCTVVLAPMHGYGIGTRLTQISNGVLQVNGGSLFPALGRLERDGLIKGEWHTTENGRRAKYYSITARGRSKLKRETLDWEIQTDAIARVLRASLS